MTAFLYMTWDGSRVLTVDVLMRERLSYPLSYTYISYILDYFYLKTGSLVRESVYCVLRMMDHWSTDWLGKCKRAAQKDPFATKFAIMRSSLDLQHSTLNTASATSNCDIVPDAGEQSADWMWDWDNAGTYASTFAHVNTALPRDDDR